MLCHGLFTLDELNIIKVKEVEEVTAYNREISALGLDSFNLLNLNDLDLTF
jgi:hypothetical protein